MKPVGAITGVIVGVATMADVANVHGLRIGITELKELVFDVVVTEFKLCALEVGLLGSGNGNAAINEANQAGTWPPPVCDDGA